MLTAEDLVDFPLKMAVRGYSVAQVDDLLDRAADSLDRLHARVADLEGQLAECQGLLSSAAETEGTLKRTLVTAQRAAEQSLEEARARAARIVEDAERRAREQAMEAERRRRELEDRIAELREFEQSYRAELREVLEQRLEALQGLGDTAAPVGGPADVPREVADLVDLPGHADDRPPLTIRVHEGDDEGPGEGGETDDGPVAWRPPEEPRRPDRSASDAETTGD